MRVLIQKVSHAEVVVDEETVGSIESGLLIFLGVEDEDGNEDIDWLSRKICNLRIFNDSEGVMNLSVMDVKGEILVVSQFTLHASTKKGNRPSYVKAANPNLAKNLYDQFVNQLKEVSGLKVETGEFGAMMDVELTNDGPVTIWIDSKNKE